MLALICTVFQATIILASCEVLTAILTVIRNHAPKTLFVSYPSLTNCIILDYAIILWSFNSFYISKTRHFEFLLGTFHQ